MEFYPLLSFESETKMATRCPYLGRMNEILRDNRKSHGNLVKIESRRHICILPAGCDTGKIENGVRTSGNIRKLNPLAPFDGGF